MYSKWEMMQGPLTEHLRVVTMPKSAAWSLNPADWEWTPDGWKPAIRYVLEGEDAAAEEYATQNGINLDGAAYLYGAANNPEYARNMMYNLRNVKDENDPYWQQVKPYFEQAGYDLQRIQQEIGQDETNWLPDDVLVSEFQKRIKGAVDGQNIPPEHVRLLQNRQQYYGDLAADQERFDAQKENNFFAGLLSNPHIRGALGVGAPALAMGLPLAGIYSMLGGQNPLGMLALGVGGAGIYGALRNGNPEWFNNDFGKAMDQITGGMRGVFSDGLNYMSPDGRYGDTFQKFTQPPASTPKQPAITPPATETQDQSDVPPPPAGMQPVNNTQSDTTSSGAATTTQALELPQEVIDAAGPTSIMTSMEAPVQPGQATPPATANPQHPGYVGPKFQYNHPTVAPQQQAAPVASRSMSSTEPTTPMPTIRPPMNNFDHAANIQAAVAQGRNPGRARSGMNGQDLIDANAAIVQYYKQNGGTKQQIANAEQALGYSRQLHAHTTRNQAERASATQATPTATPTANPEMVGNNQPVATPTRDYYNPPSHFESASEYHDYLNNAPSEARRRSYSNIPIGSPNKRLASTLPDPPGAGKPGIPVGPTTGSPKLDMYSSNTGGTSNTISPEPKV